MPSLSSTYFSKLKFLKEGQTKLAPPSELAGEGNRIKYDKTQKSRKRIERRNYLHSTMDQTKWTVILHTDLKCLFSMIAVARDVGGSVSYKLSFDVTLLVSSYKDRDVRQFVHKNHRKSFSKARSDHSLEGLGLCLVRSNSWK